MDSIEFVRPKSVAEAVRVLASSGPPVKVLAGGTDLLVGKLRGPLRILDITGLGELKGLVEARKSSLPAHLSFGEPPRLGHQVERRSPLSCACEVMSAHRERVWIALILFGQPLRCSLVDLASIPGWDVPHRDLSEELTLESPLSGAGEAARWTKPDQIGLFESIEPGFDALEP